MGLRAEQYLCSELTISARFIEVIQGPMSYCHSDVSLSISPQFTISLLTLEFWSETLVKALWVLICEMRRSEQYVLMRTVMF